MSHTIVEIFAKLTPINLFRNGSKSSPRLDKLRTMPPRVFSERFDIGIYSLEGVPHVKKDSGGVSTSDRPAA